MSEKKSDSQSGPLAYKTEEQLKKEAADRVRLEQLAAANKKPKSKTEARVENYWYHYKWITLGGVFALILVAMLIKDLVFRTDPDYTLIIVADRYLDSALLDDLADYLSPLADDVNGDGRTIVGYDSIRLSPQMIADALAGEDGADESAAESDDAVPGMGGGDDYAMVMKVSAVVAAGMDPIYLLNDDTYAYLLRGTDEDDAYAIFEQLEPLIPSADGERLPVEFTALADWDGAQALEGFSFYVRSGSERKAEYRQACIEFLKTLEQKTYHTFD